MNEILLVLLLLQKLLLSLLCQRIDDLLADESLPVCDVHNHADHQNTHNKNALRIDKRAIDMSVTRSLWRQESKTTYQQYNGRRDAKNIPEVQVLLIWWRTNKTSFNSLRNICRHLRSLLRTSQNEDVCESVMANTEKKYWCLTYSVVCNDLCCGLTNQIPQVSIWIAQRHNDQKHQNKDNLQVTQKGSQTESEKALRQFCEQNLVRTKSKQSALTINSNITSAGRDMKKSDASGDAY